MNFIIQSGHIRINRYTSGITLNMMVNKRVSFTLFPIKISMDTIIIR